jgi:hypothetical protein
VVPERSEKGYYCRLCEEEKREFYENSIALFTDHCFEPFKVWCDETLSKGKWLEFCQYGDDGGSTCVKILEGEPEELEREGVKKILVPLRGNGAKSAGSGS